MNRRLNQDAKKLSDKDRLAPFNALDEDDETDDDDEDYEPVYSLEDDLPELNSNDLPAEGITNELLQLEDEEYPYVSRTGALSNETTEVENLLEQQNRTERGRSAKEQDVYSNSMDVSDEDLASFMEGLDEEIDSALPG